MRVLDVLTKQLENSGVYEELLLTQRFIEFNYQSIDSETLKLYWELTELQR